MSDIIYDFAFTEQAPIALVMLPGAKDTPRDFISNDFVQLIRERHLPIDVVIVNAHMDYYLEKKIDHYLNEAVVKPLLEKGYSHIWFLGISLGGFGTLSYMEKYPNKITGGILLAPFLGTRGLIAKVDQAGGFDSWQPDVSESDDAEQRIIGWLREYHHEDKTKPDLYLGYGLEDRFALTSQLLSDKLPAENCINIHGGHDWPTWLSLWKELLAKNLFKS